MTQLIAMKILRRRNKEGIYKEECACTRKRKVFKELGHYFVLQGDPGPHGLQGQQGDAGVDVRIAINMGWK